MSSLAIYSNLPITWQQEIAQERDVELEHHWSEGLAELDAVMPQWFERVKNTSVTQLSHLTMSQLYVYASMTGLDLGRLQAYSQRKTVFMEVITVAAICPSRHQPGPIRKVFSISNTARTFIEILKYTQKGYLPHINRIDEILPNVPDATSVIQKLAEYPLRISVASYLHLRTLPDVSLYKGLIVKGFSEDVIPFLNRENLLFTASRGYLPIIDPQISIFQQRYQVLRSQNNAKTRLLLELYRRTSRDELVEIAKTKPHPLEDLILAIGTKPSLEIAASIGMLIPPDYDPDIYLRRNILHYRNIVTRSPTTVPLTLSMISGGSIRAYEILRNYTDTEIMGYLGVYVDYVSSDNLVDRIYSLRHEESFFISLITPYQQRRRCRNTTTMLMSDIQDPSLLIISYGTLTSHIGYEVDELLNSFHYRDETQEDFLFLHPENIRKTFSDQHVIQLEQLLSRYESCQQLVETIRNGLANHRMKTQYDRKIIEKLKEYPVEELKNLKEYLLSIFRAGMYMRRWLGPDHPYPLRREVTEQKVSPDDNTIAELQRGREILERLPDPLQKICHQLRVVEYYSGIPEQQAGLPLGSYIHQVAYGEQCIRIASSGFVATGYYYNKVFFKEDIANFNIQLLDHID